MSNELDALLARTEEASRMLDVEIAKLRAAVHMLKLQEKIMENYK
jgi:hypothetical protein